MRPSRNGKGAVAQALSIIGVSLGAIVGLLCILADSLGGALIALLLVLVLLATIDFLSRRDPLSPTVLLATVFAWLYVAKGFYLLDGGLFSSGTSADALPLTGVWTYALGDVVVAAFFAVVSFVIGTAAASGIRHRPSGRARRPVKGEFSEAAYTRVAVAAIAIDLAAFGLLIQSRGGLAAYFQGLALRSEALAGVAFLTLGTVPLNVVLLIGLARYFQVPGRSTKGLLILMALLSLGSALLTGGRAALITGAILPLIVVFNYGRRRIRGREASLLGLGAVTLLIVLGAVLRDSQFQRGANKGFFELIGNRLSDVWSSLVGGVEAVPMDSAIRLFGEARMGRLDFLWGSTYAPIPTWPIPRALWAEKPRGGGNAWFTETYLPRFYGTAHVESSISLIGESFANFGWLGIMLCFALLGFICARMRENWALSGDPYKLALYAAMVGYLLALIRGDAYHNLTSAIFLAAVWFGVRAVTQNRLDFRQSSERAGA